jgi:AcrR family transcriptional regulator
MPGLIERTEIPPRPTWNPFHDPVALALVDEVAERGYEQVEVEDVIGRAGVGESEFRARFADKEDCALRCFEAFVADYIWRIETAYRSEPDWRSGLRAAAYEVAHWMTDHPNLVRFGTVEVLSAKSEMIRVRREESLVYGAKLIDRGREEADDPDSIPEGAALIAVGSIVQLLTHRLQSGKDLETFVMVPQMMYVALRPYVGEELARAELTAAAPERTPECK